jgi:hypothetical protein
VQRGLVSRVFATLFSLWLGVCLVEPVPLHVCAMHGGLAIKNHRAGLSGSVSHAATDETGSRHPMAGHHHNDQSTDHPWRQCSCLGDCATGTSTSAVVSSGITLGESLLFQTSTAGQADLSAPLVQPHFLLPFSNGPPVLSRS